MMSSASKEKIEKRKAEVVERRNSMPLLTQAVLNHVNFRRCRRGYIAPTDRTTGKIISQDEFKNIVEDAMKFYSAVDGQSIVEYNRIQSQNGGGEAVYLIQEKYAGLYKIGLTKNYPARKIGLELQIPYGFKTIRVIACQDCRRLERELHEKFKDKRKRGEWFDLSPADVKYIRRLVVD